MKTEQEEVKHTPLPVITVKWCGISSQYRVSRPNWNGGDVIMVEDHKSIIDSLKSQLQQLQEEMKEDEHTMKILVAQVQQLQEENERLKIALGKNVIRDFNELHGADATKSDSEVKTLREALKDTIQMMQSIVTTYESDGMEGMRTRDHVFYNHCKGLANKYSALQSKGESGLDTKECIEVISGRDRMIVATVIQWLGSNCGICFLEESLKRFGAKIIYEQTDLSVQSKGGEQ
jgi:hypothetical protein